MTLLDGIHYDCDNADTRSSIDSDDELDRNAPSPLTASYSKSSPENYSDLNKTHQCPYEGCNKSFNRPAKLAQHLCSHTNTRLFACPHPPCTKDFLRESHLSHHVKSAHSNVRDYLCKWEDCGKSFVTATRLRRHHAAHQGREKFRCTVADCGQTFRKHGTLQRHVTMVHDGKKPYVCEVLNYDGSECGAGFDTESKLKSHAGRIHGTRTFSCIICSTQPIEFEGVSDGGKEYAFPTHAALQGHIANEHPPTCMQCGLKCASQSALKSHVEVLHGVLGIDARRMHVCPDADCERAFTKKGNLNAHIQICHTGKRFVCGDVDLKSLRHVEDWNGSDACGEASTSKRNLERHIRAIHLGLGPIGKPRKMNKLESCTTSVHEYQVSTLTRLTGIGYECESGRSIACLVQSCENRFHRQYDLESHLQSRHGLTDLEIQGMLIQGKTYGRPSLQGLPTLATEQDIEAERAFDNYFMREFMMDDFDEAVTGATRKEGRFWVCGQSDQTGVDRGWDRANDMAMEQGFDENLEWANVGLNTNQDVDMIDPSLS